MAHRFFEEKHHALVYKKYRISPPDDVTRVILEYMDKKKGPPHELAVDLGCGTGQNTRLLAPHFQKVVGIDVSESQLEEARAVPGFVNVTYRSGPAEVLPFPDGSVDLLTAACAAHWFDTEPFLKEAARVLKPHGCIALLGYNNEFNLHYGSCGDKLNNICAEVMEVFKPYASPRLEAVRNRLKDLFEAIPFPDKERIERIPTRMEMTVEGFVGFVESLSSCQIYFKTDPQAAVAFLEFLEEMGVSSPDTKLQFTTDYFCVLACKPQ
ncbi:uncharacterized protein Hap1MRO34_006538 isoform 2-T2 [Clarias gariepinus]